MKDFITAIRLALSPVKVFVNESYGLRTVVKYKRVGSTTVVLDIDYKPTQPPQDTMVIPDLDYLKLRIERRK